MRSRISGRQPYSHPIARQFIDLFAGTSKAHRRFANLVEIIAADFNRDIGTHRGTHFFFCDSIFCTGDLCGEVSNAFNGFGCWLDPDCFAGLGCVSIG